MARTLLEAAADVLNKSRAEAQKAPMQKISSVRGDAGIAGQDNIVDLGGSTYDNPEGSDVGSRAAAARGTATPPGVQPDADTDEPMHDLEKVRGKQPGTSKAGEETSPEENNGSRGAEHGEYAHPTVHGEEVEVSEEELEAALEEAKKERWESAKNKMKEMSCKEDIDAMFAGESLTEEFKQRAATIFEAAVLSRAVTVAESLEEDILDAAEDALQDSFLEIEEQVDTYLNYTVENWIKENQVAIESGLRSEIVEDFISGLKNLFSEHYIDIPSEKVDVVEAQAEQIEKLNDQINEALNANAELVKQLSESKKAEVLATVSEGLTDTQAVKLRTLAEGVDFTTEGEYTKKLKVIRESYFNSKNSVKGVSSVIQLTEESPASVESNEISPSMAEYLKVIARSKSL